MKKNKMLFLGLITVFVAVLSLSLVSGTYAKYTSEATGSDTATVAKWAWQVNSTDVPNATEEVTFNLFDSILDTKDSLTDADVKAGLIAPGTKGSFDLVIKNNSEVSGEVTIAIEISHNGSTTYMPLKLTVTGTDAAVTPAVDHDLKKVTANGNAEFALSPSPVTKTVTVSWEWPFSTDVATDAKDTALATEGTLPIFTANVTLTFVQVD